METSDEELRERLALLCKITNVLEQTRDLGMFSEDAIRLQERAE